MLRSVFDAHWLTRGAGRPYMTEHVTRSAVTHRWYARPVLFVEDMNRALHFYVEQLGFRNAWHSADGKGKVCQVDRSDCEIILSADSGRRDKGRLFIELTAEGLRDFKLELAERAVPHKETWWGYDTVQVTDPDGNELLFPVPE